MSDEQNEKEPQGLDEELRERQTERAAEDAAERELAANFFGDVKRESAEEEEESETEARKAFTEDVRKEKKDQEEEELDTEVQARRFLAGDREGEAPRSVEVDAQIPEGIGEKAEAEEEEKPKEDPVLASLKPDPDDGVRRRWYALHAYSGQEGNVRKNLLVKAEQEGLEDVIGGVLVPMEQVAEIKGGEKRISKRKFFPGYVLVRLPEHPERQPELWHLINNTPGVSGFIGSRNTPVPLEDAEVNAIIDEIRGERTRPKPKVKFEVGERVKIIDGPFSNFLGNIDDIDVDRGTLKVMVEIFERLTSVEVEFWQVEKI
ncbi:MAG: transcription termination/antitermination protein NusG [Pirellulaceae bacterium]